MVHFETLESETGEKLPASQDVDPGISGNVPRFGFAMERANQLGLGWQESCSSAAVVGLCL